MEWRGGEGCGVKGRGGLWSVGEGRVVECREGKGCGVKGRGRLWSEGEGRVVE